MSGNSLFSVDDILTIEIPFSKIFVLKLFIDNITFSRKVSGSQ